MRVTLEVQAGPHKGRAFQFSGHDTFLVGRSRRAHFRLPAKDRYFSRLHFLVEVNAPRCRLMDMGSRNGTFVNGEKVTRADLAHGDRIRAGHTLLVVALDPGEPPYDGPEARHEARTTPPTAVERLVDAGGARECPSCAGSVSEAAGVLCPRCLAQANAHAQPVPGYRIVRELGRGSMGIVYLAVDTADSAVVALKTINATEDLRDSDLRRFLREAEIHADLDHPHIVRCRGTGAGANRLYFAMDYVPGIDAGRLVRERHPLPIRRAVGLACQLLDALAFAHGKGFVHRDVKPTNLLLTEKDSQEILKLADFGLARAYQTSKLSGLTLTGEVGGTVPFMAPEQITHFREVKPPADQYAAAASLYYMLTGQFVYYFPEEVEGKLRAVLTGTPVPIQSRREEVPTALAATVHRALARAPGKRFPDVSALREALLPFAGEGGPFV